MPTATRTASAAPYDSMHFANFVLKRWLRSIGPVRRVQVLNKVRTGLQSLRLSRRQVYRGLIQLLSSEPCVILVREPFPKRHGSKILKQEIEEVEIFDSDSSFVEEHSQEKYENVLKPNTPFIKKEITYDQRIDGMNTYEALSSNSTEGYIFRKSEKSPAIMHPFEKALIQFEQIVSTKMNGKSPSKRSSATVSLNKSGSSDTDVRKVFRKDESHIENKTSISETVPNVTSAKVEKSTVRVADEVKRSRIKLSLNSCCSNKSSDHAKPEAYRKIDSTIPDVNKELCIANVKENELVSKNKYSNCGNNESVLGVTEASTTLDCAQRKKGSADQNKEKQREKRIATKFRSCFGDCITVSEDEQERCILRTTFKRRKLRSINSSDSEVSVTNGNKIVADTDVQTAIPDTTVDDTSSKILQIDRIVDEPKEFIVHATMDGTIENASMLEESNVTHSRETVTKVHSFETSDEDVPKTNRCNKPREVAEDKSKESRNDRHTGNNEQKEAILQEKSNDMFDKGINLSNFSKPPRVTERLVVNVPTSETEAEERLSGATLALDMPDIPTSDDELVINEDTSDAQESKLDLNKFAQVDVIETSEVTSNKGILSVKEVVDHLVNKLVDENLNMLKGQSETVVADRTVDENLNSTNVPEVKTEITVTDKTGGENLNSTSTPEVQTEISNSKEKSSVNSTYENDTCTNSILSPTTIPEFEFVSVESLEYTLDDKPAVQETTELNDTSAEKGNQLSTVTRPKLRILSSAELGSRWCPTPKNPVTTDIQFSSASTVTSQDTPIYTTSIGTLATGTVPATSPVTVPGSATTAIPAISNNTDMDLVKATSVYISLLKINNLIRNIRLTPLKNSNYDKYLYTEFQELAKQLNVDNYVAITEAVIRILNKEMLLSPPISVTELLSYTPLVNKLYIRNVHRPIFDQTSTNQTLLQDVYCPRQIQNMYITLYLESTLQHLCKQNMNYAAYSTRPKQNLQENVILQNQNNPQNNASMNPVAVNNQAMPHVSAMRMQTPIQEQRRSNSHLVQPLTNVHVRQQSSHPSIEQRKLPASTVSAPNVMFLHQNVPHTVTQNILRNIPKTVSQNVSQITPQNISEITHQNVSQIITQNIPQNVPQVNYNAIRMTTYPMQRNVQSRHTNVQNARTPAVNQQYQYNMLHRQPPPYNRSQLQTFSQNAQNCIPKPVHDLHASNLSYFVPNNMSQNKQIRAKATQVPKNYTFKKILPAQHAQNVHQPTMTNPTALGTQEQNQQISLESTTSTFVILKYLTEIQKLMLLNQIDYYFKCTTWLQQEFTRSHWNLINNQRYLLLQFQTLLKHLVEKSVQQLLPRRCEGNAIETSVHTNIMIEVPKMVKIIVKENEGIRCQVEVPKTNQETTNNNQQNLDIIVTQSQVEKQNEAAKNKNLSNETEVQSSRILDKHVSERIPSQSNVEEPTLNIDVNPNHAIGNESANLKNTKKQNLERINEMVQTVPQLNLREERTCDKNNLQQSSPHLVTVEISPDNDQVIVVDTNNIDIGKPVTKIFKKAEEIRNEDIQVVNTLESPNKILEQCEEIRNEDIQVVNTLESPNKTLEQCVETRNEDIEADTSDSPNKTLITHEEIKKENVEAADTSESPNKTLEQYEEIKKEDIQVVSTSQLIKRTLEEEEEIEDEDIQIVSTLESSNKTLEQCVETRNEDIRATNALKSPNKKHKMYEEIKKEDTQVVSTSQFTNKTLEEEEEIEDGDIQVVSMLESPNKRIREKEVNADIQSVDTSESSNKRFKRDQESEKVANTSDSANDLYYEVIHLKECSSDFEYMNTIDLEDDLSSDDSLRYQIMDVRSISEELYEELENINVYVDENAKDEETEPCLHCGKPSTVVCADCFVAKYCSRKCSVQHWEHHFEDCKSVKRGYLY